MLSLSLKIVTGILEYLEELKSLNQNQRFIFASDFNVFFSLKLEATGGKTILKRKSIAKLVTIN